MGLKLSLPQLVLEIFFIRILYVVWGDGIDD